MCIRDRDKWLYVMVAPALLWFLIFCYTPMFGIGIAFRRYQPGMSFFSFDGFVGFENFQNLFSDHFFWRAFQNSIILAVMRIAVCLPAAVFMAILLSEVKNKVFKSLVQTVTYIPHFLSWVVAVSYTHLSCRDGACPCIESGCAWWDTLHERCSVSTIADTLYSMEDT